MPGPVNRKKSSIPFPIVIMFSIFGIVLGLLVAGIALDNADAHNNNVKTGEVKVSTSLYKICDGPNLVYALSANGVAVSPNDPQCN